VTSVSVAQSQVELLKQFVKRSAVAGNIRRIDSRKCRGVVNIRCFDNANTLALSSNVLANAVRNDSCWGSLWSGSSSLRRRAGPSRDRESRTRTQKKPSKSCTALCTGTAFSCNGGVGSVKMSKSASTSKNMYSLPNISENMNGRVP
jgi:hypothetical protein